MMKTWNDVYFLAFLGHVGTDKKIFILNNECTIKCFFLSMG